MIVLSPTHSEIHFVEVTIAKFGFVIPLNLDADAVLEGIFLPIRKPLQIVAEIQPVHRQVRAASRCSPMLTEVEAIHWTTINQNSQLATKSLSLFSEQPPFIGLGAV